MVIGVGGSEMLQKLRWVMGAALLMTVWEALPFIIHVYLCLSAEEPSSKNLKREEDLSKAPVVPFGIDLHYWGKDQPTAGKILK